MSKKLTTEVLDVPGIEVLDETPSAKSFAGPFREDEMELLRQTARAIRPREGYIVAPDGSGHSIYRRPRK